MKAFLEERQRRQRKGVQGDGLPAAVRLQENDRYDKGLESLVENVKRKSHEARGNGKRRRIE
jgi:hypothetical protein